MKKLLKRSVTLLLLICLIMTDVCFASAYSESKESDVIAYSEPETQTISLTDAKCSISLEYSSIAYDGKVKKPGIIVRYDGVELCEGDDYTISYSNNTEIGTAAVTITGTADGNHLIKYVDTVTKNFDIVMGTPELSDVSAVDGSVTVKWKKVAGAEEYRVFRKASGDSSWKKLADVSSSTLSYTDKTVKVGTSYTYTVRCIDKNGNYTSGYDKTGMTVKYAAVPSLTKISATDSGVNITWSKASGAVRYKIFRKSGSGSWTALGTTTSTSFTDKTAKAGTSYTYTVRPVTSDGKTYTGGYDKTGLTLKYAAVPTLKKITGSSSGIQITWEKAKGAVNYKVFRKTGSGSWKAIATTTGTSYTDKTAKTGTSYTYTVRPVTKDGKAYAGGYDKTGLKLKYVAAPTLKSVAGGNSGVAVQWNKVSGAVNYKVFRKTSGSSWTSLGMTTNNSFTDKTAKAGTTYTYTVRCVTADGKTYTSGYNATGLTLKYAANPTLNSTSNVASGVKITWKSAKGAVNYKVFRKTGSGSWKSLGTTTGTSFTDTTAKSGTTYTYTVRSITSNGKTYTSGYDKTGLSIRYIAAPVLVSATKASSGGYTVKWNASAGAEKYRVFRKASGDSSWTKIKDTASTSYTDSSASSSKTYTYTVRCIDSAGKSYTSGYDSAGVSTYEPSSAMDQKAQQYSSSTKYLILVNTTTNKIGIYSGSKNNWVRKYEWDCTTGKSSTPTVKGTFKVSSKGKSFSGSNYTCWYYTQFYGNYLFHSVLYKKGSMTTISDGRLGQNLSHGCVRLSLDHAKWIYDNIPIGTTVYIY